MGRFGSFGCQTWQTGSTVTGGNAVEQTVGIEQSADRGPQVNDAPTLAPSPPQGAGSSLVPQATTNTCSRCGGAAGNCVCAAADDPYPNGMGGMAYPYVYALGR